MIKINNSFEGDFEIGIRNEDAVFPSSDPREESGHRRMTNFDGRSLPPHPFPVKLGPVLAFGNDVVFLSNCSKIDIHCQPREESNRKDWESEQLCHPARLFLISHLYFCLFGMFFPSCFYFFAIFISAGSKMSIY